MNEASGQYEATISSLRATKYILEGAGKAFHIAGGLKREIIGERLNAGEVIDFL